MPPACEKDAKQLCIKLYMATREFAKNIKQEESCQKMMRTGNENDINQHFSFFIHTSLLGAITPYIEITLMLLKRDGITALQR